MSQPRTSTTDEPIGALVHRLSEQIPERVIAGVKDDVATIRGGRA